MEPEAINAGLLQCLARYQMWADATHWKTLRENSTLLEDLEIRKRLNHMRIAIHKLITRARGGTVDISAGEELESAEELEGALARANEELIDAAQTIDLGKRVAFPRGPQGPFEAPAAVLLLQALTHSQHHRGQNSVRMRQLGVTPPMTDFVIWYGLGQP